MFAASAALVHLTIAGRMGKNRHHFVPRFYLKQFQSEPRRINLYNLKRGLCIENVSLHDQCYQHRFYGETDTVEDALMTMENKIAPLMRQVVERRVLSAPTGTAEEFWLSCFIALQSLRTRAAAERIRTWTNQMLEAAFRGTEAGQESELEKIRREMDDDDPIFLSLLQLDLVLRVSSDLHLHLVCTQGSMRFVTSDNPVYKYNPYCEGSRGTGTLGWGQHGFQAYVPLSPTTLLVQYDPAVYKLGTKRSLVSFATDADVRTLNRMQIDRRLGERLLPRLGTRTRDRISPSTGAACTRKQRFKGI